MRCAALALLLLVGCEEGHNPPIGGGGGGGGAGGGGAADAAPDGARPDARAVAVTVRGRVCRLLDLRFREDCASGDHSGVTVRLQSDPSVTTTTAADGSFSLELVPSTSEIALIAGEGASDLVPSLVPVTVDVENGTAGVIVPVPDRPYWEDLRTVLGVTETPDAAQIVLHLRDGTDAATGAVVQTPKGVLNPAFYDAGDPLLWQEGTQTGADGTALLFGLPTAEAEVDLDVFAAGEVDAMTLMGLPIAPDVVSFHRADIGI